MNLDEYIKLIEELTDFHSEHPHHTLQWIISLEKAAYYSFIDNGDGTYLHNFDFTGKQDTDDLDKP